MPDNNIITASEDATVRLWNIKGGCIKQFQNRNRTKMTYIIKPSEHIYIIKGPNDFAVYDWVLHEFTQNFRHFSSTVSSKIVQILDKTMSLQVELDYNAIQITTSYPIRRLKLQSSDRSRITSAEISSDLSFIVSGSKKDNVIYIWSIRPKIDELLSPDISVKALLSILGLIECSDNNSTCLTS